MINLFTNRKREIMVSYFREGEKVLNFGEHIVEILVKEFGYRPITYASALRKGTISRYDSCVVIIGTWLDYESINSLKTSKVLIWGAGAGARTPINIKDPKIAEKVKLFAVRGPLTRHIINCDRDVPTGDPAFLLPLFFNIQKNKRYFKVLYIPHHFNREGIAEKLKILNAQTYVDVFCTRGGFWKILRKVVSAKFILTNSLHAAIVAHAYNVPWALSFLEGERFHSSVKWQDVFEYLGIPIDKNAENYNEKLGLNVVKNYGEGLAWYEKFGSKGKIPDMSPLINSFPYPIVNKNVSRIIETLKR